MALQIPLSRGKIALIDECDSHLSKYKWSFLSTGYAVRGFSYKGKPGNILLHHAILGKSLNGLVVDHIDGNKLNNTRINLRYVTRRGNAENSKYGRGEKIRQSKYFGVSLAWRNNHKNLYFRIKPFINGKYVSPSYYKTEEEAAIAYREKIYSVKEAVLK